MQRAGTSPAGVGRIVVGRHPRKVSPRQPEASAGERWRCSPAAGEGNAGAYAARAEKEGGGGGIL